MRNLTLTGATAGTTLAAVVLALPAVAGAAIVETEPNDTFATADAIARTPAPFLDSGVIELVNRSDPTGLGDIDFFSIPVFAGEELTVSTFPLTVPTFEPDTFLELFDSSGTLLADDDDGNAGFGSTIIFNVPADDVYTFAVSGSPFNDGSALVGQYNLLVRAVAVPEPASLALLSLGGLALRRRR